MISINDFSLVTKWNKPEEKINWTQDIISRYGFLIVDNWNEPNEFPDFVHRIFPEFFSVKFALEIFFGHDNLNDEETILIIRYVIFLASFDDDQFIGQLVQSYLKSHKGKTMNKKIYETLITNVPIRKSIFDNLLLTGSKKEHKFNILRFFVLDKRFLSNFKNKASETIFQVGFTHLLDYFNILSLSSFLLDFFKYYEDSLGSDWLNHTGYPIYKNNSMPSNEDIDGIVSKDFAKKYATENVTEYDSDRNDCKKFLKILHFVAQVNLTPNENEKLIHILVDSNDLFSFKCSFRSSFFTNKHVEGIAKFYGQLKFWINWKNYFPANRSQIFNFGANSPTDGYLAHVHEFNLNLQRILLPNLKQDQLPEDFKIFRVKIFARFCNLKKLKELYDNPKYGYFTQHELQNYIIRHSFVMLQVIVDDNINDSNFDFVKYLREIFFTSQTKESWKSQFRKFLENRNDDDDLYGHSALSYVKHILSDKEQNKKLQKIENVYMQLLNLAKEIGMSNDDIAILSVVKLRFLRLLVTFFWAFFYPIIPGLNL